MRHLTRLFLLGAMVLGFEASALAQTIATTTTLSAAVTATATVISVTSATGFTAANYVWADAEQMLIRSVSGTTITVQRGMNGTAARAHANAERVVTGASDYFHTNDPDYGEACTRGEAQAAFSPWINVRTGVIWVCPAGLTAWRATSTANVIYDSIPTSF